MLEQLISKADLEILEACRQLGFDELGPPADRHGILEHVFHRQDLLDRFVVVSFSDAREEGADKDGLVITFGVMAEGDRPNGEHGRYQAHVLNVGPGAAAKASGVAVQAVSKVQPDELLSEAALISAQHSRQHGLAAGAAAGPPLLSSRASKSKPF